MKLKSGSLALCRTVCGVEETPCILFSYVSKQFADSICLESTPVLAFSTDSDQCSLPDNVSSDGLEKIDLFSPANGVLPRGTYYFTRLSVSTICAFVKKAVE
jgi:hypothetical protein